MRSLVLCIPLLLLVLSTSTRADDFLDTPGKSSYVSLEPVQAVVIVPGRPSTVQLHFRIGNGYHINSNRPGSDLLIPTTVKLMPPTDIMTGRITYPAGKNLSFPFALEEKLNVYSEEFTVKALLTSTRAAMPGRFTVHGQLHYQACTNNACFPPKTLPLQFDVRVSRHAASTSSSTHVGQSPHVRR
jgi:cytochrome c biogenesis DsbD-like protein